MKKESVANGHCKTCNPNAYILNAQSQHLIIGKPENPRMFEEREQLGLFYCLL